MKKQQRSDSLCQKEVKRATCLVNKNEQNATIAMYSHFRSKTFFFEREQYLRLKANKGAGGVQILQMKA